MVRAQKNPSKKVKNMSFSSLGEQFLVQTVEETHFRTPVPIALFLRHCRTSPMGRVSHVTRQPVRGIKKINGRLKHEAADGLGIAQGIRAAQALRKRTSVGLIERREIRLQAPINSLLTAPLSGQGAALIAESIIRWPFITDH